MAIITLRIPDELKIKMDLLDEINWSAVTRNLLEQKVEEYLIKQKIQLSKEDISNGKIISHKNVKEIFQKNK